MGVPPNVIVQSFEGNRMPSSELDFNMMMIDGRWGDPHINEELHGVLKESRQIYLKAGSKIIDRDGREVVLEKDTTIVTEAFLWGELALFTRDLRLGFLKGNDYRTAIHYQQMAADCLRLKMYRACLVAMTRVATLIELSQSFDGNLRKLVHKKHSVQEMKDIAENPNLILGKKSER